MSLGHGPIVYDGITAKRYLKNNCFTIIRDRNTGLPLIEEKVWVDVETDPETGWFCLFVAYPRDTSPYITSRVGNTPPHPDDLVQNKLSDIDIIKILNNGAKETRTQWWHTSVEFGTVWASGDLNSTSTYYNLFEDPTNWSSNNASAGQRFKRKTGANLVYTDWIVSSGSTCSSAVGGWSNHSHQNCTVSWFAGCEGGPAWNHKCAGGIQDRAEKLVIWGR